MSNFNVDLFLSFILKLSELGKRYLLILAVIWKEGIEVVVDLAEVGCIANSTNKGLG